MGNWSLTGILVTIGVFFALFGFLLSQINVTTPEGLQHSVLSSIWDMINPFSAGGEFSPETQYITVNGSDNTTVVEIPILPAAFP